MIVWNKSLKSYIRKNFQFSIICVYNTIYYVWTNNKALALAEYCIKGNVLCDILFYENINGTKHLNIDK